MENLKSIRMNMDSGEKTWITPKDIIDKLGPFDLDPCCPKFMPYRTATDMVSLPERNGLEVPWTGKRVWLNPPYGRESVPFLRKMADNKNGIAMIFARTDTDMWKKYVFPYADSIFFKTGRVNFLKKDGSRGEQAPAPTAFIAYTQFDTEKLLNSGIPGTLVKISKIV